MSSDRDQRGFDEYYSTMPFGALIFEDREAKTNICSRLKVRSIPHLVMLGPCSAGDGGDRQIINDNLRSIFDTGDYLRDFPYVPKRYGDLNKTVDNINSFRCVIVFCENGDDEEQESVQSILRQCAESTAATELSSMRWLWADAPTGLAKKIREVLKFGAVGSDQPVLVLLDIPNQGSYYIGPSATTYDLSVESVLDFVNNPGDRHQL